MGYVRGGRGYLSGSGVASSHDLGGATHDPDTLANLNSIISDATLIDTGDPRLASGGVENGIAPNRQTMDFERGSSQYASVANPGILGGLSNFSVEFWCTTESIAGASDVHGLSGQADGGNEIYWIRYTNGNMQFMVSTDGGGSGAQIAVSAGMVVDAWYHWALTWEGGSGALRVYRDGVLVGSANGHTGTTYASTAPLRIGKYDSIAYHWDGKISEHRLWGTTRTIEQINDTMFKALSGSEEGLLALHHLDGNFRDAGGSDSHMSETNGPIAESYHIPFSWSPNPIVEVVTLGANATTLSIPNLDGDVDGIYEVEGQLLLAITDGNLQIRPNGVTSNLKSSIHDEVSSTDHGSDWRLGTWTGVTTYLAYDFKMYLYAAKSVGGSVRRRRYHLNGQRDGGNFSNRMQGGGVWNESTSKLTSLDFVSSVASGILAGSKVTVRRVS